MRLTAALAGLVLSALAVSAAAQDKPNFAGKWVLVVDSTASAATMRTATSLSALGELGSITQDEKAITLARTMPSEVKFVLNIDGSESKNSIALGGVLSTLTETLSRVRWEGARMIVVTTVMITEDRTVELTSSYALDGSGNLIIESNIPATQGAAARTSKLTYKKG
jgi:hypothetical protein